MDDHCKYCGSARTVPVLDKRIERSPKPGNKYRAACLECERWLPVTSESEFRRHSNPHVLPADAASDAVHRLIPLEEYDYDDEWADLVESETEVDTGQRAIADGGAEEVYRFLCPECSHVVDGKPDECPHCDTSYRW